MDRKTKLIIDLAARHDPVHTDAKAIVAGYIQGVVKTEGLIAMIRMVSKKYAESADLVETIFKGPNSGLE